MNHEPFTMNPKSYPCDSCYPCSRKKINEKLMAN